MIEIKNQLEPDLGEDAGSRSDSAVHDAVENGKQTIQRKGLRPQKVITCLKKICISIMLGYNLISFYIKYWTECRVRIEQLPFHFSSKSLFFLFCHDAVEHKERELHLIIKVNKDNLTSSSIQIILQRQYISSYMYMLLEINLIYLHKETFICAGRVVGGQIGSNQQKLGIIRKFNVSVSRQTFEEKIKVISLTLIYSSVWPHGLKYNCRKDL